MAVALRSSARVAVRASVASRSLSSACQRVCPVRSAAPLPSASSWPWSLPLSSQWNAAPRVHKRWYAGAEKTVVVPGMGDSISEGTVKEWTKGEGEGCKIDDVVCLLETDKITVEVRAPEEGSVVRQLAKVGDDVRVGQELFVFSPGAVASAPKAAAAPPKPSAAAPSAPSTPSPSAPPKAAPAASAPPAAPKPAAPAAGAASAASAPGSRGERRVKMSKMRQRISQRLKESQDTAAMLTTFNEVDMAPLMALRNKHKDAFEKKHGVKLGFMAPFVKAVSSALRDFPVVNAVIESDGEHVLYRDYHDVSVAVAAPNGLVVPVLRNVESLSLAQIESSIGAYGKKAKEGTLAIEDMSGGTFTISNGGTYGSLFGTPIINPPQSAILGMHAIKERPYVVDGVVVARPIMYVALTYDHRLIDGREAVLFLKKVKAVIEEPELLLLDL